MRSFIVALTAMLLLVLSNNSNAEPQKDKKIEKPSCKCDCPCCKAGCCKMSPMGRGFGMQMRGFAPRGPMGFGMEMHRGFGPRGAMEFGPDMHKGPKHKHGPKPEKPEPKEKH